jgi:hypothetical protein
MKPLFWVGIILLVLGIGSLFYAIPQRERHGVQVGDANIGVTTTESRRVPPLVSAVMILGGIGLMIASRRRRTV